MLSNNSVDLTLGSLQTHDHPCSIYETPEQLKQQFVPYLQAGLALGEACVYFVDENEPQFVIDAMREHDFDIDKYLESGQFQVIHTKDAHLKGEFFAEDKMLAYWNSALSDAKKNGFKALRAAVEMTWALSGKPGCDILAPYESRLTNLMIEKDASAICMYSRTKFTPDKIKAIIHAHPLVVFEDVVLTNPACPTPDKFVEGCPNLDVQAILDNLTLIKTLAGANSQLTLQKQQCESLYQDLQQLARVVSHEMQEPLKRITSYLRLLTVRYSDKLGEDADEFIHIVNDSAEILVRMIDDLWSYARVDSSDVVAETIDAVEVLGDALYELKEDIQATNAKIVYDRLPKVFCRRRNFQFVLKALIQNACKYNQFGTAPHVEIKGYETPKNWCVEVKDNGRGMDEVFRSEVFKMYNRLDGRPGRDGTGMGLAIAKKMIEHEGGEIWFDSEVGKGSTFFFTIPKPNHNDKIAYLSDASKPLQAKEA